MRFSVLVGRYAKALIDAAVRDDKVDEVGEELRFVAETVRSSRELTSLMTESIITKTRKVSVLERLFKDRISELTINFLKLLVEKNRESMILEVYEKYHELYLEHKGIAIVSITTAVTLDEATKERIVNILRQKVRMESAIEVNNIIDKNIIGGFIVDYKDFQYDASVRGAMKRLKKIFSENLFVKGF